MNRKFWLNLSLINGIGNSTLHKLYDFMQANSLSEEDIFSDKIKNEIYNLFNKKQIDLIFSYKNNFQNSKKINNRLIEKNITALFVFDKEYPSILKNNLKTQAPFVLYLKGNISLLKEQKICVVGTRNPSEISINAAYKCVKTLSEMNYTIISGGAIGIDTIAHLSALNNEGKTIFILPYGLMNFNPPPFSRKLINSANSLIISQFHPYQSWNAGCAIMRNMTMAAISSTVIVAETGISGGTQHTANFALKLNKPLIVFDFNNTKLKQPSGNNYLINNKLCISSPVEMLKDELQKIPSFIKSYRKDNIPKIQMSLLS